MKFKIVFNTFRYKFIKQMVREAGKGNLGECSSTLSDRNAAL